MIRLAELVIGASSRIYAITGDLSAASGAVARAMNELADVKKRLTHDLVQQLKR